MWFKRWQVCILFCKKLKQINHVRIFSTFTVKVKPNKFKCKTKGINLGEKKGKSKKYNYVVAQMWQCLESIKSYSNLILKSLNNHFDRIFLTSFQNTNLTLCVGECFNCCSEADLLLTSGISYCIWIQLQQSKLLEMKYSCNFHIVNQR